MTGTAHDVAAVSTEASSRSGLPTAVSVVTARTMAGAVGLIFWILRNFESPGFMAHLPILVSIPLGLPLILGPMLTAGAIWGRQSHVCSVTPSAPQHAPEH